MALENVHDLEHDVPIAKKDDVVLVGYAAQVRAQFGSQSAHLAGKRCQHLAFRDEFAGEPLAQIARATSLGYVGCYAGNVVKRLIGEEQPVQD